MEENQNRFLWPQENRKLMRERIHKNQLSRLDLIKQSNLIFSDLILIIKSVLAFLGIGNFKKAEEKIMYIFNGSNTKKLTNKFDFLEICHKLGYSTPKQILIHKNQSIAERKKIFNEVFRVDGFGFYVKPVKGYGGKGIRVFNTKAEVEAILSEITEDTLIVDTINIHKEFRYILYSDPEGNNWHLSFEKTRSFVIGNGKSKLVTLIIKSKVIPLRRKVILIRIKFKYLLNIIPKNHKLLLENKCSYGKLPNDKEIDNLDKFAPILIKDLEYEIGHKLPILCFDFGVTEPIDKDLTFDKLKEIIIPFECQLPFSPLAHFKFMRNGFWPFIDFYRMLIVDMLEIINKRIDK